MKKKIKYILIALAVIFVFGSYILVKTLTGTFREMLRTAKTDLYTSNQILKEDSSLIGRKYITSISPIEIFRSRIRNSPSSMMFNKDYILAILPIETATGFGNLDVVHTEFKSSGRGLMMYNVVTPCASLKIYYQSKPVNPASVIFLSLKGDSIETTFRSDSILCYHLNCKYFSIKYLENADPDYYIIGGDLLFGLKDINPMDLLLLRRKSWVYCMVMVPISTKMEMPSDLLRNVVLNF